MSKGLNQKQVRISNKKEKETKKKNKNLHELIIYIAPEKETKNKN